MGVGAFSRWCRVLGVEVGTAEALPAGGEDDSMKSMGSVDDTGASAVETPVGRRSLCANASVLGPNCQ